MPNKHLLTFITSLITFGLLAGCAGTPANSNRNTVGFIGRGANTDRLIDQNWRFVRMDMPGAEAPSFNDSHWQKLNLPHTWNNYDGQDGGNNYYRGPGWYRTHLSIPGGKNYFLRFDAASTVADVYVNGTFIGEHRGNFAAFCFDITRAVHPGDNVIAVRVDNSHFEDVPPLAGDFTIFGGIYRDVHLLTLADVGISPTDDASPGVYIEPTHYAPDSADVKITTKLRNSESQSKDLVVSSVISDESGKVVATDTTAPLTVAPTGADAVEQIHIDYPHLWNGRSDPYLYHVKVRVLCDGKEVDQITQPLGLRYFHVDPERGFFLNGHSYPLHGVNRHQDRLNMGWAIGQAEHDQDMALILEMGSNAIRLAHYQHADYFYHLCDKNGLVVWAEFGLINKINHTATFYDNTKQQLRELIKQNFNHPSIMMWSLFNELAFKNNHDPREWELVKELNDEAHRLDPTRVTTAASNRPYQHPVNWITDIVALNCYYGWYNGTLAKWPGWLDAVHAFAPNRCVGISEYGAGASIYMHEYPAKPPPDPHAGWRSEEYQALFHETVWRALKSRPWIWGTFIWNQFDFAVDFRNEGDTPGRNDKGLVTYDRKTRKDAFYFYKANWTTAPMVHINSARFNPRPAGPTQVKVYSNCPRVELFLNGKSLGTAPGDTCVFTWPVTLKSGANHVKASAYKNGAATTDQVTWQCK